MNPVLQDFIQDLARLRRIIGLSKKIVAFPSETLDPLIPGDSFLAVLQQASKDAHNDMPILNGMVLLYLAGRFENYVKEIFEDLCSTLSGSCTHFGDLPRKMRAKLIEFTGLVVANPRKYGHAEKGVMAFVTTLSENLNGNMKLGVNVKCLSITEFNMRPDTVAEIFARIGADKIWERLGQQATVQAFFEVSEADKATSEARLFLNTFMELRNNFAHPSSGLIWPSTDQVERHITYCETIARAISDLCTVWAVSLLTKKTPSDDAKVGTSESPNRS